MVGQKPSPAGAGGWQLSKALLPLTVGWMRSSRHAGLPYDPRELADASRVREGPGLYAPTGRQLSGAERSLSMSAAEGFADMSLPAEEPSRKRTLPAAAMSQLPPKGGRTAANRLASLSCVRARPGRRREASARSIRPHEAPEAVICRSAHPESAVARKFPDKLERGGKACPFG